MKRRLVVVGLDGACWEIINRIGLDRLPNLKKIVDGGCSGNLISTIPYVTAPAWTSAFTGVNPGKHGIFNFTISEGEKLQPLTSNEKRYPMIWDMLGKNGLKTIAVAVPLTYPAKKINGVMVTGFGTPGMTGDFAYPDDIKKLIKERYEDFRVSPLSNPKRKERYIDEAYTVAKQNSDLTKVLMEKYPDWDLTITVFSSTDWTQHFFWDDTEALYKMYGEADKFLGWLFDNVIDEKTYVVIMSDHGFVKNKRVFSVFKFLNDKGMVSVQKNTVKSLLSSLGITKNLLKDLDVFRLRHKWFLPLKKFIPQTKQDSKNVDVKKSKIFFAGRAIHLNCSEEEKMAIKKQLEEVIDPKTGTKPIKLILDKNELYWGGDLTSVPDLFLEPAEGYQIETTYDKNLFRDMGEDDPAVHSINGVHAFYGGQIRKSSEKMKIWDITPMILHILGQPLYNDMDGVVYRDVFDEDSELRKTESKKIINIKRFSSLIKKKKG